MDLSERLVTHIITDGDELFGTRPLLLRAPHGLGAQQILPCRRKIGIEFNRPLKMSQGLFDPKRQDLGDVQTAPADFEC